MGIQASSYEQYAGRLQAARDKATSIAKSQAYRDFVEMVRARSPWRFKGDDAGLEVFLRGVDHHLQHFVPRLLRSIDRDVGSILEFGCGTGSAAIALTMVFPDARCHGVDIDTTDVSVADARAKLYGVSDRCTFASIDEGARLAIPDNRFDLCTCCSVLEYVTDPNVRKTCVQEMARVVVSGGLLFFAVPNRMSPIEIHTGRLGWNWFPKLLNARVVGSTAWEVKRLARPHLLKLYRTPMLSLVRPWTSFLLRKES